MLEIGEDKSVFEVVPTYTFKLDYHQLFLGVVKCSGMMSGGQLGGN